MPELGHWIFYDWKWFFTSLFAILIIFRDHSSITSANRWVDGSKKDKKHSDVILEWSLINSIISGSKPGTKQWRILNMKQYQWQTWALRTLKKQSKFKKHWKNYKVLILFKLKFSKICHSLRRISYCFLFLLSLEEIVDTRGLDSYKRNIEENISSAASFPLIEDDE